ncbi:pilus assembly protein TadG-related protein [Mesorhizobium sp. CAU 1741]|uniref:pilus assembly protein TadG-related protein n=1 Tax=Mesorhizobium sp. CAU 1741 TaxID=3140366 RepID=UPI00325AC3E4
MHARPSLLSRARRFLSDSSGHFALLTAFVTPVAIVLAAIAVDTGSLYVEKRRAQGLADLAAITAAGNLQDPERAAIVAMADNGVGDIVVGGARPDGAPEFPVGVEEDQIVVVPGRYDGQAALDVAERFTPNAGAASNAVKVTYRTTGTRYFGGALIDPPQITVSALAETTTAAAFSVGSRLAALEGGIVNALLSGLLGSDISLSVMDYNALLDADVRLLSFLDALALEIDLTAGTYVDVLDAEITLGQLAEALSQTEGLGYAARSAAATLANQASSHHAANLQLSKLIDLGDTGGQVFQTGIDQIGLDVGVLDLVAGSAIAAGRGKQVALDLGAAIPGLLTTTVSLAIGEPPQHAPWYRVGSGGELVRTAQTRLSVIVEVGMPGSLVSLLGARIRIPLYLEVAFAEAKLKSIACDTGPDGVTVEVDARPGVADLYLGEVDPSKLGGFANPLVNESADLVKLPLIRITGKAHAEIAETDYRTLTFSASDIEESRIRQVSTTALTRSLVTSLFQGLELDAHVSVGGILNLPLLSLPSGTLNVLGSALGAVTPAIDTLLARLLSTLGLALGQADVQVHGATCGRAVLVQ